MAISERKESSKDTKPAELKLQLPQQTLDTITCPITSEIMLEPVGLSCGHFFESEALNKHIKKQKTIACPMCRKTVATEPLIPGFMPKSLIDSLINKDNEETFYAQQYYSINYLVKATEAGSMSPAAEQSLILRLKAKPGILVNRGENGVPGIRNLFANEKCLWFFLKHPHFLLTLPIECLNFVAGSHQSSIYHWLIKTKKGINFLMQYPQMLDGIPPETLNAINKNGFSLFYLLCASGVIKAPRLLNLNLIRKANPQSLNAIAKKTSNVPALFWLLAYRITRSALITYPEFLKMVTPESLNARHKELEVSAFYFLTESAESLSLLNDNPQLLKMVNFESLTTVFKMSGNSAIINLLASEQGRTLLATIMEWQPALKKQLESPTPVQPPLDEKESKTSLATLKPSSGSGSSSSASSALTSFPPAPTNPSASNPPSTAAEFKSSLPLQESLLKSISCPLSKEIFYNPVGLSCGDFFESEKLTQLIGDKTSIDCPSCKKTVDAKHLMPGSSIQAIINNLAKITDAIPLQQYFSSRLLIAVVNADDMTAEKDNLLLLRLRAKPQLLTDIVEDGYSCIVKLYTSEKGQAFISRNRFLLKDLPPACLNKLYTDNKSVFSPMIFLGHIDTCPELLELITPETLNAVTSKGTSAFYYTARLADKLPLRLLQSVTSQCLNAVAVPSGLSAFSLLCSYPEGRRALANYPYLIDMATPESLNTLDKKLGISTLFWLCSNQSDFWLFNIELFKKINAESLNAIYKPLGVSALYFLVQNRLALTLLNVCPELLKNITRESLYAINKEVGDSAYTYLQATPEGQALLASLFTLKPDLKPTPATEADTDQDVEMSISASSSKDLKSSPASIGLLGSSSRKRKPASDTEDKQSPDKLINVGEPFTSSVQPPDVVMKADVPKPI